MTIPATSVVTQHREALLAMAGLALSLFLVSLDQTVVGTAMPEVIAELNGFELYAWVATMYLLAQTVALPLAGKLGDRLGRKWLAIGGVVLFVAASAFCGVADSMPWLIVGRGLQGAGAGVIMATVFTLVADIFPDLRERARYQGMLFAVFALSSVIGPLLGGWITDNFGWRWIFYINLPLGLLSLLVLPRVLPQSAPKPHTRMDYWGALSISLAIIGLLLGVELVANGHAWRSPEVVGCWLVAGVALAVFIPIERRAPDPVIPFSLFQNRTVSATILLMFFFGMVMFGLLLYTPLFMQAVLGLSASGSGVLMLPMSFAMPVVGIIVGQMVAKLGVLRPFMVGGTALMAIGLAFLTTVHAQTPPWLLASILFVIAVGMGAIFPVANLLVQTASPPPLIGVATSTLQFLRLIGSTIGTAIVGSVITQSYITGVIQHAPAGVPPAALATLDNPNALVSQDALDTLATVLAPYANGSDLLQTLLGVARLALENALRHGFILMLVVILLALVCGLFIEKLKLAERKPAVELAAA